MCLSVALQEHAKKMRAMAAQAEAQKGMEPDHPIDRWNLVILSEKGPRYRGLAKGEIGEVISSKYKVRGTGSYATLLPVCAVAC
jgi:hypothetical protein